MRSEIWVRESQETDPILDSHFGHDKSLEIKPYAKLPTHERPTLLYAGDGVSDLSAAAETDLLFAKKGNGKLLEHLYPRPLFPLTFPRLGCILRTPRNAIYSLRRLVVDSGSHERHSKRKSERQECCSRGRADCPQGAEVTGSAGRSMDTR